MDMSEHWSNGEEEIEVIGRKGRMEHTQSRQTDTKPSITDDAQYQMSRIPRIVPEMSAHERHCGARVHGPGAAGQVAWPLLLVC